MVFVSFNYSIFFLTNTKSQDDWTQRGHCAETKQQPLSVKRVHVSKMLCMQHNVEGDLDCVCQES